mgnify:CR=1 FL=1
MLKRKVSFDRVSKSFSLYSKQSDKLMDLVKIKKSKEKNFYALNQISFEVFEGETIGVIGVNGSGKSTLSNLLAGVVPQTDGTIEIDGETSLIAISVGLNNNLSGIENIELKCLMHGLNKDKIKELTPKIIDFADIGHFINQPVKNYSSGMKSRLGFAISVFTEPDVLIIDEALSVGDETFYQKCIDKINEFKSQGKTIFFISHSISQIRSISDKVLWLHFGNIKEFGYTNGVLEKYSEFIKWFNNLNDEEKRQYKNDNLQKQIIRNNRKNIHEKNTSDNANRRKFVLQTSFLLLLTIISGLLMFKDTSSVILNKFENISMFKEDEKEDAKSIESAYFEDEAEPIIALNKPAKINSKQVTVYYDKELNYKLDNLYFSDSIFVEGGIGNIYKIEYNGTYGFIKSKHAMLIEEKRRDPELSVEDFVTLFPNKFVEAYEYYFAFFNGEYDEIYNLFTGGIEEVDNRGRKKLYYEFENFSYAFNQNNIVESIQIYNIMLNSNELSDDLLKYAEFNSEDKSLYYFELINYDLVLDLENNIIEFHILKE